MENDYRKQIPENYPPESRIWIYQSDRTLSAEESSAITRELHAFCTQWKSHGSPVKGIGHVLMNRFIVLLADERQAGVSGCSTDSSVQAVKSIQEKYGLNLFDRLQIAFLTNERVVSFHLNKLADALQEGKIGWDALFFDNSITHLKALRDHWIKPLKDSWLAGRIRQQIEQPATGA